MNNQMNNMGGYQQNPYYQQNLQQQPMMNQQPMQQHQPQEQTPVPVEGEKKFYKKLIKPAIFFVIFLIIFFGVRYINYITVDYQSIVTKSLSKYYISSDSKDLEDISDLLVTYKKNPKMIQNIQKTTYTELSNWLTLAFGKYQCNNTNYNTCVVKLEEFKKLKDKIEVIKTVKGGGYLALSTSGYTELKNQNQKVIDEMNAVQANRGSYGSPQNSETIYKNTCKSATDCQCREGICTCVYNTVDGNGKTIQKEIKCYKPETIEKKN